jgi:hypothetical protein
MHIKSSIKISLVIFSIARLNFGQNCKAQVEITTDTDSSIITIDSKRIAQGKAVIELTVGRHSVQINENSYLWDGKKINDFIILEECSKKYSFKYSLPQKRFINTVPQDAAIFREEELIGYTPNYIDSDIHSVLLKRKDEILTVDMKNISLPILLRESSHLKNGNFADSDLFKILIGSAAVLGSIAAYYKIQADQMYDDYKYNSSKTILDKVNRFDLYSGLALGILQINFGYLIYRFLSD